MSDRWTLAVVAAAALVAPAAMGQERPTSTHAMGPDGSVYYTLRDEGSLMRVAPDGTSELVANTLDAPTGVSVDEDGNVRVADEVGIRLVNQENGTLMVIRTEPTPFQPFVRFDQHSWAYRAGQRPRVKIVFSHNLQGLAAAFDLEVSKNGGRTWKAIASGVKASTVVWRGEATWPIERARFRVTAYVDGQRLCSDVSDQYQDPAALGLESE